MKILLVKIKTSNLWHINYEYKKSETFKKVKWTVGIGQSVKVRGSYRGPMSPVGRMCIRVKYGIDDSAVFNIRQDELDQIDDEKWSFETVVRLCSNKVWSPSGKDILIDTKISVDLTVCYPPMNFVLNFMILFNFYFSEVWSINNQFFELWKGVLG